MQNFSKFNKKNSNCRFRTLFLIIINFFYKFIHKSAIFVPIRPPRSEKKGLCKLHNPLPQYPSAPHRSEMFRRKKLLIFREQQFCQFLVIFYDAKRARFLIFSFFGKTRIERNARYAARLRAQDIVLAVPDHHAAFPVRKTDLGKRFAQNAGG